MALRVATFAISATVVRGVTVTPLQKVLQMMDDMLAKATSEKQAEETEFAAFSEWCDGTKDSTTKAIAEGADQIEQLTADIAKGQADAEELAAEAEDELARADADQAELDKAQAVRDKEHADYSATHADLSESIDAVERAIAALKSREADVPQSLLEVKSSHRLPAAAKASIESLLALSGTQAPEANAYEFQSHGVIEMLEKLLDKFVDERTTLEKEEMNSKHAFDMLMQDLKAQIGQATQDRGAKAESKANKLQAKADATGDLKDTTSTKEADQKYLSDLTAECEQKASDFESRQQLRADEIVAIEKAIEIISSGAVSGNADKHLPGLLQKKGPALAQLRSSTNTQNRVAKYLEAQATKLNSRVLAAAAAHAADDPFKKVKKMIKDLIVRLMEEANEEAEHKGWCDTELSTNEQTRKEKTEAVETLHAEIDQLQASIAKLTEDIGDLTKAVAELDAAMAEATKLRTEEKAKNTETISDSQEAQTAVAQALTVLKEFYAKAAEATAFVQKPEIFDSPYKGMNAEGGGVVGMLEVIESDFARLESDTKAAEATAQKEYDDFMTDSKVDKSQKSTDIEHKTAKKQDESQALTTKNNDLEGTQKELDAALAYFDKLKPSCVDSGVSYEDRVGRRKEEIESLQEALKILNGEDIA